MLLRPQIQVAEPLSLHEVDEGCDLSRMGFAAAWFLVGNFICSYGCCGDIAYDYGVPAWFAIPFILDPFSIS